MQLIRSLAAVDRALSLGTMWCVQSYDGRMTLLPGKLTTALSYRLQTWRSKSRLTTPLPLHWQRPTTGKHN